MGVESANGTCRLKDENFLQIQKLLIVNVDYVRIVGSFIIMHSDHHLLQIPWATFSFHKKKNKIKNPKLK